jgi:hypothetical protein
MVLVDYIRIFLHVAILLATCCRWCKLILFQKKSVNFYLLFKLCTNKTHSYKHNEQINNQNIDNSECFGVKFVKIYPEMTSQ